MGSELEALISFWKASLAEHRLLMSPDTIYLVEKTIKRLETQIQKREHPWKVEELDQY